MASVLTNNFPRRPAPRHLVPQGDEPIRDFGPRAATVGDMKRFLGAGMVSTPVSAVRAVVSQPRSRPASSAAQDSVAVGKIDMPGKPEEVALIDPEPDNVVFRATVHIIDIGDSGPGTAFLTSTPAPGVYVLYLRGRKHRSYDIAKYKDYQAGASEVTPIFTGQDGRAVYTARIDFGSQDVLIEFMTKLRGLKPARSTTRPAQPAIQARTQAEGTGTGPKTSAAATAKRVAPGKGVRSAKPAEPGKEVEPVRPVELVKPVEPTKSAAFKPVASDPAAARPTAVDVPATTTLVMSTSGPETGPDTKAQGSSEVAAPFTTAPVDKKAEDPAPSQTTRSTQEVGNRQSPQSPPSGEVGSVARKLEKVSLGKEACLQSQSNILVDLGDDSSQLDEAQSHKPFSYAEDLQSLSADMAPLTANTAPTLPQGVIPQTSEQLRACLQDLLLPLFSGDSQIRKTLDAYGGADRYDIFLDLVTKQFVSANQTNEALWDDLAAGQKPKEPELEVQVALEGGKADVSPVPDKQRRGLSYTAEQIKELRSRAAPTPRVLKERENHLIARRAGPPVSGKENVKSASQQPQQPRKQLLLPPVTKKPEEIRRPVENQVQPAAPVNAPSPICVSSVKTAVVEQLAPPGTTPVSASPSPAPAAAQIELSRSGNGVSAVQPVEQVDDVDPRPVAAARLPLSQPVPSPAALGLVPVSESQDPVPAQLSAETNLTAATAAAPLPLPAPTRNLKSSRWATAGAGPAPVPRPEAPMAPASTVNSWTASTPRPEASSAPAYTLTFRAASTPRPEAPSAPASMVNPQAVFPPSQEAPPGPSSTTVNPRAAPFQPAQGRPTSGSSYSQTPEAPVSRAGRGLGASRWAGTQGIPAANQNQAAGSSSHASDL